MYIPGLIYTIEFENIAISAAQDLFEGLAPTDACLWILAFYFEQSSDYGNAEAEGYRIQFVRGEGSVTSGSGGASVTPVPQLKGGPAAGSTWERNNTTRMVVGAGALKNLGSRAPNAQLGQYSQLTLPEIHVISPGDRWTAGLVAAPADAIQGAATVVVAEIGG